MESLIVAHDGVIHAARLGSGKPLKAVNEEIPVATGPTPLNPDTTEFIPRLRCDAAVAARARVQNLPSDEQLDGIS